MKEVIAIIQPHRVESVVHALHDLMPFPGFTLLDSWGQGRGRGAGGAFAWTEENIDLQKHTILFIFCNDEAATEIVQRIQTAAHTGNPGDGLITVRPVERTVRIRTGEVQERAL